NGVRSVYATDVDGDNDIDILGAASGSDEITWWENLNGFGTNWLEHTIDAGFDGARSVFATDLDGDGDEDVLGAASNADEIKWWENVDGTGTNWSEHTVGVEINNAYDVHASDMDGDGDTDVLGAANYGDEISWWENLDGTGTDWSEHTVDDTFDGASSVHPVDLDGDGDMDVLGAANMADEIVWWENLDGLGLNWSAHWVADSFDGANSVSAADVDGDGDMDVLGTAYYADDLSWWENVDGIGTNWTQHRVGWMFDGANTADAADFDGDGDIDLIGCAYSADQITIWMQTGSPGPPDPVIISITPANYPTIIPQGGWLEYGFEMMVNINQPADGYIWTMATLPNGQSFGPLFNVQFTFAPGMSITVDGIQQHIISYAPLGTYEWIVNAGPNLLTPVSSDSFPFTVVAGNATSDQNVDEWTSMGQERIVIAAGADALTSGNKLLPQEFSMSEAYPNPFNSTTTLSVTLPHAAELNIRVFNIAGQQIAELADGTFGSGNHKITFDAAGLGSGLYFVRATVSEQPSQVQKVMLVR
ncbi:MAG TPA: T9SS type A sorting domain-containing protein, partial [Bacteroidetes bacterium]|nr:T9SS type A sorting domain-containing protein [Bacteroidota bacterium]HEX03872.1 T9SS type A sorting domain-containing protein [Bacteroidota bacterium]